MIIFSSVFLLALVYVFGMKRVLRFVIFCGLWFVGIQHFGFVDPKALMSTESLTILLLFVVTEILWGMLKTEPYEYHYGH